MPMSNVNSGHLQDITGDTDLIYSDKATALTIVKAGGVPLYLPSLITLSIDDLTTYLNLADGILLTGAVTNMNPLHYDESPLKLETTTRIDDDRDHVDIELVRLAYKKRLPILGICKGMQTVNVALGGTLYQDIASQHLGSISHDMSKSSRSDFTHKVAIEKASILGSIFHTDTTRTNGGHQQGVKELGKNLKAVAAAEDGIIEAFEGTEEYPFLLGVQFHPELRTFDQPFFEIFQRFVTSAQNS